MSSFRKTGGIKKDINRLNHHSTTINTLVVEEIGNGSGEVGGECICLSQGIHKCELINSMLVAVINLSQFVSPKHITDCAKNIFFPSVPTEKGTWHFWGEESGKKPVTLDKVGMGDRESQILLSSVYTLIFA